MYLAQIRAYVFLLHLFKYFDGADNFMNVSGIYFTYRLIVLFDIFYPVYGPHNFTNRKKASLASVS